VKNTENVPRGTVRDNRVKAGRVVTWLFGFGGTDLALCLPSKSGENRISRMRVYSNWPWHLDEVFVKTNGERHNLWRAVDQEGEVLESYVTVTDLLWFYGAAMKVIGNAGRQGTGRLLNNLAEISHMPFRRRGWAILRFWRMQILQNFVSGHSSVCNHFNQERHLYSRDNFKLNRTAVLA